LSLRAFARSGSRAANAGLSEPVKRRMSRGERNSSGPRLKLEKAAPAPGFLVFPGGYSMIGNVTAIA
jgi:hypothetical protein